MGDLRITVGDKTVVVPVTLAEPVDTTVRWSTHGPFSVIPAGQHVILDRDASVAGLTIQGTLEFDPTKTIALTSRSGSVVVDGGTLRMRPATPSVYHSLTFTGFTDASFGPGGGDAVVPSDIGLWCHNAGVLDLHGAAKNSWTNLTNGAPAGASDIVVNDATGWRPGDQVVVTSTTPHAQGSRFVNQNGWEQRTVQSVDGNVVRFTAPLTRAHGSVSFGGRTYQAEVLNLTRNVYVGGTSTGRAHIHVMAHDGHGVPFNMDYVEIAHVGPSKASPRESGWYQTNVLGRYGLHFHKTEWALKGSTMTGIVVRDCRSHAFVPHMAHGITFKDCISHLAHDTPYWWDFPTTGFDNEDTIPTHELVYDRCVASANYNGEGFFLAYGWDQVIRNCVVTGATTNDSHHDGIQAYNWQASSRPLDHTVVPPGRIDEWIFEDNLAHNTNGPLYYWQNNVGNTLVKRLTAYFTNREPTAGAYINAIDYIDYRAYRVGSESDCDSSFDNHASSAAPGGNRSGFWIDSNGETPYALGVPRPPVPSSNPTVFRNGHFQGGTQAQVYVNSPNVRFINCTYAGNAFWLDSDLSGNIDVRVQDAVNGNLRLWPLTSTRGVLRPAWNCRVETV